MSSPDLKVVFVELGRIPKHLSYNNSRLYELFPDISIVLITDQVLNHS